MKGNTIQVCVTNSYLIFEYLCCSSYFRGFLSILTAPNHDQLRGAGFLCPSNRSQGTTFCFPDTCKPWKRIDISEVIISLTLKYVFLQNQIHFKALLQQSLSWPIIIRGGSHGSPCRSSGSNPCDKFNLTEILNHFLRYFTILYYIFATLRP